MTVLPETASEKNGFYGSEADPIKKRSCPIHGTKAYTSAIPPKLTFFENAHSLHVPSYMPRWITGGDPVSIYWKEKYRSTLPSEVHSPTASRSISTIRNSL